ncbi:MAG: hypothetical protein ACRYG2_04235 [Janthinobacterium lividum]
MIVTVLGAARLGELVGLPADDETGLLRLVEAERGSSHVLVLTPSYGLVAAREQAHVLVAAHRETKVCVLPLDHHALTLTLIAYDLLSGTGTDGDPSQVLLQVRRSADTSRSLLWYPRLWGLTQPSPSLRQSLADAVRRTGWFQELDGRGEVVSGRTNPPFEATDTVHHLSGAPALLVEQLGGARALEVPLEVERAPYWARSTVELTVLRPAPRPQELLRPCRDCGAGLLDGLCPFCGHGPVTVREASAPAGYLAAVATATTPEPVIDHRPLAPVGAAGTTLARGENP